MVVLVSSYVATITLTLATMYFGQIGASSSTTVTTPQPSPPIMAEFICRKQSYPIIALDFTLPTAWNRHYLTGNFTERDWAESTMIKLYYQEVSLQNPEGDGKWVQITHCSGLNVMIFGQITCLYEYGNVYTDAKAIINIWYNFKIEVKTPSLDYTLRNFVYNSGERGGHNRREFGLHPAETFTYDFSNQDVFLCLDTYKPFLFCSGECDRIRIRWYWPAELFAFQNMLNLKLAVRDEDNKVLREHTFGMAHQTFDRNETGLTSNKAYKVCLSVNYHSTFLHFASNSSQVETCEEVYVYCRQKLPPSGSILTVEWTVTIISLLSVVIFVLLIVLIYIQKRRVVTGESELNLIDTRAIDQNIILQTQPVQPHPYTPIDYTMMISTNTDQPHNIGQQAANNFQMTQRVFTEEDFDYDRNQAMMPGNQHPYMVGPNPYMVGPPSYMVDTPSYTEEGEEPQYVEGNFDTY